MNENVREGDCRRFRVFPSSLTPIFMPPGSLLQTDIKENGGFHSMFHFQRKSINFLANHRQGEPAWAILNASVYLGHESILFHSKFRLVYCFEIAYT